MVYIGRMDNRTALDDLARCAGNQRRLSEIIGVSPEQISRWRHGVYPIPEWVSVMAELMDRLPRKDWPERWKGE